MHLKIRRSLKVEIYPPSKGRPALRANGPGRLGEAKAAKANVQYVRRVRRNCRNWMSTRTMTSLNEFYLLRIVPFITALVVRTVGPRMIDISGLKHENIDMLISSYLATPGGCHKQKTGWFPLQGGNDWLPALLVAGHGNSLPNLATCIAILQYQATD